MEIEYAYCSHCGAEYNVITFLAYERTTSSGDVLRCKECGGEITDFCRKSEI